MSRRPLAILTYHSLDDSGSVVSIAPRTFEAQMQALARAGFVGITLREAVEYREQQGDWPAQRVVLTFDDAYASLFVNALPVLVRHGFSATVFVITGYVGRCNDWAPPPPRIGTQPLCSWEQLAALVEAGWEPAAHTHTHPDLRGVGEYETEREILFSRDELRRRLGCEIGGFAYPYGLISPTARRIAREHFRTACTTVLKRAGDEPLTALPRVDMFYVQTVALLERLIAGRLDRYLALRRWGRRARHMLQ